MTEINFTRLRKCTGADNGEINSKHSGLSIIQLSRANSPDNLLGGKKSLLVLWWLGYFSFHFFFSFRHVWEIYLRL